MRNFSDMYIIQDDHLWTCYFESTERIDYHTNDKNYLNKLEKKLIEFHVDYLKLSQLYQICEVIPSQILKTKNINLENEYIHFLVKTYYQRKSLSFFPFWNNKQLNLEINYPSSNLMTLIWNGSLKTDYVYSRNINEVDFLEGNTDFNSDFLRILPNSINQNGSIQISFSMEVFSDFWFETVSRNHRLWDSNYGEPYLDYDDEEHEEPSLDNRFIAYRNTPRFNSFLRDLKALFVDKYGWSYDSDYEDIRRDGIPLDGKIIYQEDIDEGRVTLPGIETFGKIVESGQFL